MLEDPQVPLIDTIIYEPKGYFESFQGNSEKNVMPKVMLCLRCKDMEKPTHLLLS